MGTPSITRIDVVFDKFVFYLANYHEFSISVNFCKLEMLFCREKFIIIQKFNSVYIK